jgi:phospholipase D1/2
MKAASPLHVRAISTIAIALLCVLALVPSPASAWSFSSIFGNDDDESSGSISVDKSNGSDVTMQQPLLKATSWFLTEEEITASRGGSPRSGMATYSTGNAVTTFTVTKEFFDSVYGDLSTTKEDDRVMLASWNTDLIPLVPDVDPTGAKSNFDVVFGSIVKRGGDVKILGWANKFLVFQDVKVRNRINKLPKSGINDANALFIFDDRLPYGMSSQHQKTLVIAAGSSTGADDHPVAYVGGIDLSNDRWDTIYHNESALRKETGIHYRNRGWVDSSMRIHGPAAKDVANNFLARWNSPYLPTQGLGDDLVDFDNPQYSFLPPLDYASSNTTSTLGNQSVQIVRTFSCKYKHWEFAPYGENSLFQARLKAIKNARNYIYIEDQYFILVPELLAALMEVMPGLQRLIVVVQPPELLTKSGGYEKYMYENVQPLKEKFPNKLKMYSMKPDLDVYMHSKLVVIDDVYLADGSANWNRRSMTSDPELDANVVDNDVVASPDGIAVGKLVRDFRVRKFQEMTGRSYDEIDAMKFLDAANLYDKAAAEPSSLIQKFEVDEEWYFNLFGDAVLEKVDPQDTCDGTASSSS